MSVGLVGSHDATRNERRETYNEGRKINLLLVRQTPIPLQPSSDGLLPLSSRVDVSRRLLDDLGLGDFVEERKRLESNRLVPRMNDEDCSSDLHEKMGDGCWRVVDPVARWKNGSMSVL